MAVRRTSKRKPMRAHGALVINPRKKAPARRKRASSRKTVRRTKHGAVRRTKGIKSVTVRTNGSRRRRGVGALRRRGVGSLRLRRNPYVTYTAPRKRRRKNPAKRKAAPRVTRARRNPAKRKTVRRRKNPSMTKQIEKIPFVGPALAATFGVVPSALVGAVAVEPQLMINDQLSSWYPEMKSSTSHALAGILLGAATTALVPWLGKVTKMKALDKNLGKLLGAAIASSGGGVAYYIMRTEQDAPVADQMGALALRGVGVGNPLAGIGQVASNALGAVGVMHGSSYDNGIPGIAQTSPYGGMGNLEMVVPTFAQNAPYNGF